MSTTTPSWRALDLDGVGAVEVRRPTLRDTVEAKTDDPVWWVRCVRWRDTQAPLTRDEVLDMDAACAGALAQEVIRPRPIQPPSGGSGD